MILTKLSAAALLISIATGPLVEPDGEGVRYLTMAQKKAAVQTRVRLATECIARKVAAYPHFHRQPPALNLGDLIVESVPNCVGPVRAMIEAYDRFFGEGSGEAFFMGPYLDALPAAVSTLAADQVE